ncbi:MAG TPA: NfeD family protein [Planctomycetota bacterium]|nr:NfeD family protein [Planctomycetota bacterium]
MDLGIVVALYLTGLGMIVAETMLPGITIGVIGLALMATSVYFGFRHHWAIGTTQLAVALGVTPLCFYVALRKLTLKASLEGGVPSARDGSDALGREGEAQTDLRPAGIVLIDGKKIDVVTSGEPVDKGRRVRVVQVEGNRIVVRAI